MASASAPARVWLLEVSVSDNMNKICKHMKLSNGCKSITMTGNDIEDVCFPNYIALNRILVFSWSA